jgi:beta-glucuronidase
MKKHFSKLTIHIFFTSCTILLAQSVSLLQNVDNRTALLLDGQWQTIVDPLENGYFKNQKMASPSDLIEYDFDTDTSLDVPRVISYPLTICS